MHRHEAPRSPIRPPPELAVLGMRAMRMGCALLATAVGACGGAVAGAVTPHPRYEREGQVSSTVQADSDQPFIIEWPAAELSTLDTQVKHGIVAVEYRGTQMRPLWHCRADGKYLYTASSKHPEDTDITTADDLRTKIPAFGARFEAAVKTGSKLHARVVVVGRFTGYPGKVRGSDLHGDGCARATHIVSAYSTGAFELTQEGSGDVAAGGAILGVASADGSSSKQAATVARGGRTEACDAATTEDAAPPKDCDVKLRLELAPIEDAHASPRESAERAPLPAAPAPETRAWGSSRVLAIVTSAIGIASLGTGAYFGLRARSKNEDSKAFCNGPSDPNGCTMEGVTLRHDATTAATAATIAWVSGGVALAGGIVLWMTAPKASVSASVRVGANGVAFGGAF